MFVCYFYDILIIISNLTLKLYRYSKSFFFLIYYFRQSRSKMNEPNTVNIGSIEQVIRMRPLIVVEGTKNCKAIEKLNE